MPIGVEWFMEGVMRSDIVYRAMKFVSNRYLLTQLAAKATRKLHRPNTRIAETTNDVLIRFSQSDPLAHRELEPSRHKRKLREAA
jgi:hypothetical protein